MTAQETVDYFAQLARPRVGALLRLSTATHLYDPVPGALNSQFTGGGVTLLYDRWKRGVQPYKDLQRFVSEERVMQSVIDPGLLPIAKAISADVRGSRLLVTRRIAAKKGDIGAVAHVEGYGIRVVLTLDEDSGDTLVAWECLYGVA